MSMAQRSLDNGFSQPYGQSDERFRLLAYGSPTTPFSCWTPGSRLTWNTGAARIRAIDPTRLSDSISQVLSARSPESSLARS
jgi:hypothetical protein